MTYLMIISFPVKLAIVPVVDFAYPVATSDGKKKIYNDLILSKTVMFEFPVTLVHHLSDRMKNGMQKLWLWTTWHVKAKIKWENWEEHDKNNGSDMSICSDTVVWESHIILFGLWLTGIWSVSLKVNTSAAPCVHRVHTAFTTLHPTVWMCLFSIVPYICSSDAIHWNVVQRRWCHCSVCQLWFWVWTFLSLVSSAARFGLLQLPLPNSPELWSNILTL